MKTIDNDLYSAIFSRDEKLKKTSRKKIRQIALSCGIYLASIHKLYQAFGQQLVSGFTVPAINIRTLTYDTARVLFKLMLEKDIGPLIFEIARSEISYTQQTPDEYATTILAAAICENYKGPVFIQGDHFQFKASVYKIEPETEIDKLKNLIKESIEAGFYNIDIDASTLVDLNQKDLNQQQKENCLMTALLTKYIRGLELENITISIGGEIGHIGGKNSTEEEFVAFMNGYLAQIKNDNLTGISKVSVQTGTSHGGVPLPDGTIAKVKLDFDVLKKIGNVAREKYNIGGPVQHGASTLPLELFDQFPKTKTMEIHLATGFQNIVYEYLPADLKGKIYNWLKENCKKEWKEDQSEEQFIYKTRKKALGPFKQQIWNIAENDKQKITDRLYKQFYLIFEKLNVFNTLQVVKKYG